MDETANAVVRARVFVSYSRRDADFAEDLAAHLLEDGFGAFVDKKDIAAGEPWKDRLAGLIATADTVAFVVSPDSVMSPVCAWELAESERLGKRILPIVCRPVRDADAPAALARLNYVFATDAAQRSIAFDQLQEALETDLEWVREHTRLTEIALHWMKIGKPAAATLRGRDLDDAEHWLSHRPSQSSTPTEIHRDLIRASRHAAKARQRAWVGGSAAVAVLALGLAGFAEISRRDAVKQRDAAEVAKTEAQTQQARADRSLETAVNAANTFVYDIGQRLRDAPGMPAALVKSIIGPAVALQDKLAAAGETDPELRDGQSHALNIMAATLLRIGETAAARDAAQHALDIARSVATTRPGPAVRTRRLLESLTMVGDAAAQSGRQADALGAYRERLSLAETLDKTHSTNASKRELLLSTSRVATLLDATGKLREALHLHEQALPVARGLAASIHSDETRNDLAALLQEIGVDRIRLRDPAGAHAAFEEALAVMTEHRTEVADSATTRTIALLQQNIAHASMALGDKAGALASIGDSVDTVRRLAWDKSNAEDMVLLANTLFMAGGMRLINATDADERTKARALLDESIVVSRKVAEDHANAKASLDLASRLLTIVQAKDQLKLSDADVADDLAETVSIYRRLKGEGRLTDAGSRSMKLGLALQAGLAPRPATQAAQPAVLADHGAGGK